jgi:Ulp1 family protease
MSLIMDGMDQSHSKCPYLGSQNTVLDCFHVYIPICVDDQRDSWSILIIEPQNKTIIYYDPKVDTSVEEESLNYSQRLNQYATGLEQYLSTATTWRRLVIKSTINQVITPDLTDFNSGIYCAAFVERYLHTIPLIFGHNDMVKYRINLCYDLLCENMQ